MEREWYSYDGERLGRGKKEKTGAKENGGQVQRECVGSTSVVGETGLESDTAGGRKVFHPNM